MVLSQAAIHFHKSVFLSSRSLPKSEKIPNSIKRSNLKLARLARKLRIQQEDTRYSGVIVVKTRAAYKAQRAKHRMMVRSIRIENNKKRSHPSNHLP